MGLTIHYSLKSDADSPEQAQQQVEQLRQAALDLPMAEVGQIVEFSGAACEFRTASDDIHRYILVQAQRMMGLGQACHFLVPDQVIAFSTWPGEECELANFGLCRYPVAVAGKNGPLETGLTGWSWQSWCKTQYASNEKAGGIANFVRCHLAVIRLLDQAKAMGVLESVRDESHFWDKRDVKALVETVGEWNRQIAGIVGLFKDQFAGDSIAPIAEFPDFEHLEAEGRKGELHDPGA